MRKLLTSLFVLSILAVPAVSDAADGTVSMTWGTTCTPLVQNITPTAAPTSLIFSVFGNDQTHNSYQVRFLIGDATKTIPEAWEFDAAGCQGSSFITINHLAPASAVKTCPNFQGTNASLQIKDYSFVQPGAGYETTMARGVLANTYPAGFTTSGATRYFLAQFLFDHSFSVAGATTPGVDCGGFETPMCIVLQQNAISTSSYVRAADNVEVPFDFDANNWVTVNGYAGCPATPAKSTTWGSIKNVYR